MKWALVQGRTAATSKNEKFLESRLNFDEHAAEENVIIIITVQLNDKKDSSFSINVIWCYSSTKLWPLYYEIKI